ncbi:MAG: rod shape-determining protein RodA [Desulforegulaceae bacterium]|nr:rod shape-determining protein RodA [Desulforegulaceae bacterium]
MIDKRVFANFDWVLFVLILVLFFISLGEIYSATHKEGVVYGSDFVLKQGIWFFAGLLLFFVLGIVDYHFYERWSLFFYWAVNLCLIYVLYEGKLAGGSQRWISFGIINFQPSELSKISLVLVLARHFSKNIFMGGVGFKSLALPIMYTMIPFFLILKQPDLGTAGILVFIASLVILFVKVEKKTLLSLVGGMGFGGVVFYFFFLKEYQKERIISFLNPGQDPLGAGYHIIQSKIAIGSGMFYGKGYCHGTQNALSFLPEQHTDFIFSVFAEEWGFLGSIIFLSLYFFILVWGLKIAGSCRNKFGIIVSVGVVSMVFWQLFINLGMVMGIFPVVGMPLPLISYGGTSVITIMSAMGILMSVSMRNFMPR